MQETLYCSANNKPGSKKKKKKGLLRAYDGTKIRELVGIFMRSQPLRKYNKNKIGLSEMMA